MKANNWNLSRIESISVIYMDFGIVGNRLQNFKKLEKK